MRAAFNVSVTELSRRLGQTVRKQLYFAHSLVIVDAGARVRLGLQWLLGWSRRFPINLRDIECQPLPSVYRERKIMT